MTFAANIATFASLNMCYWFYTCIATSCNSKLLVGGNGTAWSSSNTDYKYCVIDAVGSPGYLTAG